MNQISAAENYVIDFENGRWRLTSANNSDDNLRKVMVEAISGQPLRYVTSFASTRRLPREGMLDVDIVRQVVLGWSQHDESWHLGLLLRHELADQRGSRWCELAYWPDPDQAVFADLAREAGSALADVLDRPLNVIPPRERPVKVEAPPAPLPDLPLICGDWLLDRELDGRALVYTRSSRWVRSHVFRVLWYLLWVVLYVILSIATLNTDLALPNAGTMLPNPELLPYIGLGAAIILFGMALYALREIFRSPDRIVVDPESATIAALRGSNAHWQYHANDLQSVYVTQVVSRKGKKKRTISHSELNLHLGGGDFRQLFQHPDQETIIPIEEDEPKVAEEGIIPLKRDQIRTDVQAAALYTAEALGGLPAWYDQRTQ